MTTYAATLPDGSTATRKTSRHLSYLVAGLFAVGDGLVWSAISWSGSFDLATKRAHENSRMRTVVETRVIAVEIVDRK